MRKMLLLSILGLTLSLSIASAQGGSLEFMGGFSMQPYSVKGDVRSAAGALGGGNTFLRYTYYFPGHFGLFAQIGTESVYGDEASFFGPINKADGERYLYRFSDRGSYESEINIYSIGMAYRWDVGIFRFTPRAAVGMGDFSGYDYAYERRDRNGGSGPEFYSVFPISKSQSFDYLIDDASRYYSPSPMLLSADFQISVMADRRLFLFLQPGVTFMPFRIRVCSSNCGSVPRYNPKNWAETLAYSDATDLWKIKPESEVTSVGRFFISPFLHLSMGVGINFGYKHKR